MDKYEYRVSLNEINSLVEERRFAEAAQIADTIDWRKVKSKDTLCRISDIYKICKDYERARDILDLANQRNPHIPEIIYSLCELTIFLYGQTGSQADLAKALGLKQEYQSEYPDDPKRLILEYKFYKVSPVTLTEKIATLEQLRDEDHSPRWGYELASLYHQADMDELAIDECKALRRQFSDGRFVERAAALEREIKAAQAPQDAASESPREDDRDAAPAERDVQATPRDAEDGPVADAAETVAPEERSAAPEREMAENASDVREAEAVSAAEAEETVTERVENVERSAPLQMAVEDTQESVPEAEADESLPSGIRRIPYQAEPVADEADAPETAAEESPAAAPERETTGTVRRAFRIENVEPEQPAAEAEATATTAADDQLSVGQVYDEWERIRKDIRKRNDEKRAQRIMEDTGPLLQDFDETARHGLIEAIEKDAARERRQIRSGAAGILGGNGGYGDGRGGDYRYNDGYGRSGGRDRNRYEDSYDRGYDDRRDYEEPARDRYNDSYEQPVEDRYNDRYDDRYDDRYAEPAEDRYSSRYDDRPNYEPLPEPEDCYPDREDRYPEREEIHAETVHEEAEYEADPYEETPRRRSADNGRTRGEINDHRSGIAAGAAVAAAGAAGYAAGAARGSRFNAAVGAADAAANAMAPIADAAENLAEDDDIATRRWNSDEIREAMERQRVRIAEAQAEAEREAAEKAAAEEAARIAAEEEARRKAEEERVAAEKARIEAEIRARYEAEEKARIEAEEKARREAEERAAAEAKAREEEAARARMYEEIEARIRAEYEERERARLAAATAQAVPVMTEEPAPAEVQSAVSAQDAAPVEDLEPVEAPVTAADAVPALTQEPAEEVVSEQYEAEPIPAEEPLADEVPEDVTEAAEETPAEPMMVAEPDMVGSETAAILQEALQDVDEAPAREPVNARAANSAPAVPTVSAETAEMPASAASSIAAAGEKAPSEEELHLFGPFYRMKENRDQVTAALDRISLASYTGNIIITGNAVTARRVAQGLLELTREADSNFTGKIAKATGTALNKLTEDKFRGILTKIQNGALIIEHASTMEEAAVQRLYDELEHRDRGVIVVMMDARKPLDAFLAQYSGLVGSFTARVDIRPLNDKALVDYGKDYANTRDYALDELAELALSSRISSMQSPNHRVTLKEVRDIIDEAIMYASKKTPHALMEMISRKRYDADDRIILHEKDFQHY